MALSYEGLNGSKYRCWFKFVDKGAYTAVPAMPFVTLVPHRAPSCSYKLQHRIGGMVIFECIPPRCPIGEKATHLRPAGPPVSAQSVVSTDGKYEQHPRAAMQTRMGASLVRRPSPSSQEQSCSRRRWQPSGQWRTSSAVASSTFLLSARLWT